MKKLLSDKDKNNKNEEDIGLIENLLDIFEKVSEEKNDEPLNIDKIIKDCKDIQEKCSSNKIELDNDQPEIIKMNEKDEKTENSSDKLFIKFKIFIAYMKRIFATTLTNNTNVILEDSPNDILKTDSDELKNIKDLVNKSLGHLDKSSYSSLNENGDFSHRNNSVYNSSLGFPDKFHESEDNIFISQLEYCEGLSIILPIIQMIESSFSEVYKMFSCENFVSQKLLEVSFMDHVIEEWDKYKEFITGRVKNAEFEEIYHFQETILDNYQLLTYSIKLLVATLGNSLSRIPPSLLARLPIKKIDNIDFDNYNFEVFDYTSSSKNIETIILNDLNMGLLETV